MPTKISKVGGLDITRISFFSLDSGEIPRCDGETIADAVRQLEARGFVPAPVDIAQDLVGANTRADLPSDMDDGRLIILFEKDEKGHPFVALVPNDDNIYHGNGAFPRSKFTPVFLACVRKAEDSTATKSARAA